MGEIGGRVPRTWLGARREMEDETMRVWMCWWRGGIGELVGRVVMARSLREEHLVWRVCFMERGGGGGLERKWQG